VAEEITLQESKKLCGSPRTGTGRASLPIPNLYLQAQSYFAFHCCLLILQTRASTYCYGKYWLGLKSITIFPRKFNITLLWTKKNDSTS
jgi:hypothetical protein